MSDSDNYFSDSDKSNNDETNDIDPLEPEYEMDEESLRIIREHTLKNKDKNLKYVENTDDIILSKKLKKKKTTSPTKKAMSFSEFNEMLDIDKPKAWSGKKFGEKKKKLGLDTKQFRRSFNPRYPPPNHLTFKKNSKKDFCASEEDFPELDKDNDDISVDV